MEEFIAIFRHEQPFVAEMILGALKKNGIACYMQNVAITGLITAAVVPVAAPGVEYAVYVPKQNVHDAKRIIDELPIDKEKLNVPWTGGTNRKRNKLLLVYWIVITGLGIPFIIFLFHNILKFFKR